MQVNLRKHVRASALVQVYVCKRASVDSRKCAHSSCKPAPAGARSCKCARASALVRVRSCKCFRTSALVQVCLHKCAAATLRAQACLGRLARVSALPSPADFPPRSRQVPAGPRSKGLASSRLSIACPRPNFCLTRRELYRRKQEVHLSRLAKLRPSERNGDWIL